VVHWSKQVRLENRWPTCLAACSPLLTAPVDAEEVAVTGIQAAHRHGQTFVTWQDVAQGEAGANYRYSLYRSTEPITAASLPRAQLCYRGVLNNSAKLYGSAFNSQDRLDPQKPYAIIEEGGQPLPPWIGLAVHTVQKPGSAYYALVATDLELQPQGPAWERPKVRPAAAFSTKVGLRRGTSEPGGQCARLEKLSLAGMYGERA
jgi:hypothetical protein